MALISVTVSGMTGFFAFLLAFFQFDYSAGQAFGIYVMIGIITTAILMAASVYGQWQGESDIRELTEQA